MSSKNMLALPTWVVFLVGLLAGNSLSGFGGSKEADETNQESRALQETAYRNGHAKEEGNHDENLEFLVRLVIVLALIVCSMGFEHIKHQIEHVGSKRFESVVEALFGEMTVLGFLSLCTFCVVQTGGFSQLSEYLYGDEEKLQETFEFIHFSIFFIMVVYVFTVTVLIKQAKFIEEEWSRICQLCHELSHAEMIAREEVENPVTSTWSRIYKLFFPQVGGNDELLVYYGLRKEFVLERDLDHPFEPKAKDQRVEPSFNFSMYLSRCLEKTLGHIVEVHYSTWLSFALFSVMFYGLSVLVDYDVAILSWAWLAIEWFALLFSCLFHHHLCSIKRAMAWKLSTCTHSNALEDEGTHLLGAENQLPDWCKIPLPPDVVEKKQPNRQQLLFWFGEHGPEAYLIILQINLVFTGIYWAMLLLEYFPYMFEHEPAPVSVSYVILAAAPFLLWQKIARNLVSSITQVCSIGYLRKHDAVANVIRDQKMEAMIRAFLVLHKVLNSVESATKKWEENLNIGSGAKKALKSGLDSSSSRSCGSLSSLATTEVGRTFDSLDESGDGFLEPYEIMTLLKNLGMSVTAEMSEKIVGVLDTDGDGVVSKAEFTSFYEECVFQDDKIPTPKEKARILFDIFDDDGDGEITTSEFVSTLEAFHLGFSLEDIGDLLRELDEDSSGTISLHEFEKLVEKYFPKEAARET